MEQDRLVGELVGAVHLGLGAVEQMVARANLVETPVAERRRTLAATQRIVRCFQAILNDLPL